MRTVWLDNLKAIAIILMVLGHSGVPFTHWIFLFHMAAFYIAAGYTWNDKHIQTPDTLWKYLGSKVKTLYIPYILCNIFFLLLNNVFVDTGLYASSDEYLRLIGSDDVTLLHTRMSLEQILKNAGAVCLLMKGTELGGPTWFFASLFFSLCAYAVVQFVMNKLFKKKTHIRIFQVVLALMFLVIAWMISEEKVGFYLSTINRFFAAYPLLVIRANLKLLDRKIEWKYLTCIIIGVLAFFVLLLMNSHGSISMARCKIENPLFFLVVSLAGWFLLASISRLIPRSPLAKLSASTRSIVMWHFISMKTVTLAYILLLGLPMILIGAFPFLENTTSWMWIVYTAIGVIIPYILGKLYDFLLKDSIFKI